MILHAIGCHKRKLYELDSRAKLEMPPNTHEDNPRLCHRREEKQYVKNTPKFVSGFFGKLMAFFFEIECLLQKMPMDVVDCSKDSESTTTFDNMIPVLYDSIKHDFHQ